MIKNLRYLCTLLLIAVASAAWGAEEVYITLDFANATGESSNYTSTWTATAADGTEFTMENFNRNTTTNGQWNYVKCGRKNNASVGTITTFDAIDEAITKVVVTIDAITASKVNSIKLYTSSDGSSWTAAGDFTKSTGTQAVTLASPAEDLYYKVEFDCASGSSNGLVTVSKVEYYYNTSGADAPTISAENLEIAYDATSGAIEYTINNEPSPAGILTASTTSDWLILGTVGTTVPFTCSTNGTGAARTATVTLTYTFSTDETVTADVTVTQALNPNGPGSQNNPYTVAQARDAIDASSGTTDVYVTGIISQIDSYSSQYKSITYWISDDGTTTDQFEVYSGKGLNGADFSAASDIVIGATVIVYGNIKKYNSTYEFDKNNYLVSYTAPAATVETPTFSPAAGTYTSAQSVEISCATAGATIYYTLDGTDPTSSNAQYNSAISVSTTTTIKAIAIVGSDESTVATATYHFCSAESPYTVAQALAFNEYPANGIYVSGIVSTAPTQAPTNNGEMTYYISDNGEATNQLEVYKGKGLNQAAFTTQDDIKVGDIVTIYGNVKIYNGTTEFESGNYLVAFERPQSTDPVINAENVTIAYNVTEGSIAYTIENGDENTTLSASTEATWLTLGTVTESSVPFTCSANDDDPDRTATVILTYGDVSKEVTVTQKQKDCADLPFVWEGGVKADLLAITGVTAKGLGTDYAESHEKYRVKFDETGDYIQVKTNERPGIVTIGVKMIGGATASSIIVQQSVDGNTFTDLQTLTISGSTNEVLTLSTTTAFAESSRYVRLYFNKGSNVGVGPITISQYADIVLDDYILTIADSENVNITATYDEKELSNGDEEAVTQGTEITLAVTPASGYVFDSLTISGEEEGQTVTPVATSTEGVWTFTMPSFNVTINATVKEYVAPVTANYTLATTITPGKRYVIANSKEGSVKVMGDQGNNNRPEADATIANGVLTTLEQYEFVIKNAVIDDVSGYSIYDESVPGYLYAAGSDKNYLKTQAENNINGLWTITIDEETGAASVVAEESSNRNVMQYNSTNLLFACYASASQSPVYLFEKETKLGDVNNDGHVDVADVTALVNALKEGEQPEPGDIDGENGVNAEDVRALVEMILSNSNQ